MRSDDGPGVTEAPRSSWPERTLAVPPIQDIAVPVPHSFTASIFARPDELRLLRDAVRRWLNGAGVPADETADVLVAVGEACANAIEHAYRFDPRQRVDVELSLAAGRLTALVRDTGSWVEPAGSDMPGVRGRGRSMMEMLMDRAVIETGPQGTTVRLVRRVTDED